MNEQANDFLRRRREMSRNVRRVWRQAGAWLHLASDEAAASRAVFGVPGGTVVAALLQLCRGPAAPDRSERWPLPTQTGATGR